MISHSCKRTYSSGVTAQTTLFGDFARYNMSKSVDTIRGHTSSGTPRLIRRVFRAIFNLFGGNSPAGRRAMAPSVPNGSQTARTCTCIMSFPSQRGARTTSRLCDSCRPTAIVRCTAPGRLWGCVDGLSPVRGDGSARFCGGGGMATASRYPTTWSSARVRYRRSM
jgi:hypothetical protein